MRYVFADFTASTSQFELRHEGERIDVEPKPLRLLLLLLSRAPETVANEEILTALWPDETVTRSSLFRAVGLARRALKPGGSRLIQTVRGRGYRIAVPVTRDREHAGVREWAAGSSFVGRDALLSTLEPIARTAASGAPRTVLIAGEPGVGKTRLVQALCDCDALDRAEIVWGRCLEGTGTPPLHPWLQILRDLVRSRAVDHVRELLGDNLAIMATVSEEFRALQDGAPEVLDLEAEQLRFRFLDACARFFESIARDRPLVFALDDLHNADALSLALWDHVARIAPPARLLLIGAYRHVAAPPNPPLERAVAATAQLPSAGISLTLEGLDVDGVDALLAAMTKAPVTPGHAQRVHERTAGNPLFVRGIARAGETNGATSTDVLGIVRSRLFPLDAGSRSVLEAAAVIGREFDVRVVAAVLQLDRAGCLGALDEAYQAGLVVPQPGDAGRWSFVHMVVGETLYADLQPGKRAELHVAIARVLEGDPGRAGDVSALVAQHYREGLAAADANEVRSAAAAAAERALSAYSFEEAVSHLELALDALDYGARGGDADRLETLLSLGSALANAGARERRREVGWRAVEIARKLGPEELARAAVALYDVKDWAMENQPEVVRVLEEALEGLPDDTAALRAHLTSLCAHAGLYRDLQGARAQARAAVEIARGLDSEVLRETLYIQHYVAGGPDARALRLEIANELAKGLGGGIGSETEVIALVDTACDRLGEGDPEGARFWYETARAASGDPPYPAMGWYLANYRAGSAFMRGDYEAGDRLSLEALENGTRIDQPQAGPSRAAHLMILADARGDPGFAADLVEVILGDYEHGVIDFAASAGADFSARAGRMERTREIVEMLCADEFRGLPRTITWPATMVQLAHSVAALGDRAWAAQLEVLIAPVESWHGIVPGPVLYRGSLAGARARLLETLGRSDEAAVAYRRAISNERALGAKPWWSENEQRLGLLVAARG